MERFILSGKVSMVEDRFLPHDSIINENHLIDVDSVFRYWEQQVTVTPSHSWACRQLVLTILREGTICSLHDRDSKAVSHAISKLVESKEWPLLKQLLGRLACRYPRQRDALLLLAKIFVHRSNSVVVEEAMAVLDEQKLTTEQKNLKAMIEAERLWWTGCYEEAKAICRKQLCQNISNSLRYECRMHMGVADFFLGNWADALDSFSFANDIFNQADPQVNAWALYLSATIVGLRGTDIRKGKEWFYMGDTSLGANWRRFRSRKRMGESS